MDKNKIIQVLLNLLRNAGQALREKKNGTITVKTEKENAFVLVQITDNGSGIPEDHLNSIWEPFFTTKGERGTGIGLDICKRIIEGHNGTISVHSRISEGTTFTFSLPIIE